MKKPDKIIFKEKAKTEKKTNSEMESCKEGESYTSREEDIALQEREKKINSKVTNSEGFREEWFGFLKKKD